MLTYSFNFDEEEFPRLETPYFPGIELLETDIDKEFIMSPGKWLYGILNITCGPDDENPLPLCNDHARIADLETALDCEVKLKGFGRESKGQASNLILFSDIQKEYEKMRGDK